MEELWRGLSWGGQVINKITTKEDIQGVKSAATAVVRTLDFITPYVRPGITTEEINDLCHKFMRREENVESASLGYKGFPKSICTSVNNVVCHGIPSSDKKLNAGDIVNIDIAVIKNGYYGDSSRMYGVGKISSFAKRLVDTTREALYEGIRQVKSGKHLGDIGEAIQKHTEDAGFSIVHEYCGHGIGKEFHCSPQVLHYGKAGKGLELSAGMCFTIEPMVNAGVPETRSLSDNWTVVTKDGKLSAQWEHTVLINVQGECEVLTLTEGEVI